MIQLLQLYIMTLSPTDRESFRLICIQNGGKDGPEKNMLLSPKELAAACRQFAAYLRAKNGRQH